MFTFFYTPNTCALASHVALIDADAAFQLVRIDFASNQQRSPDYLKVNPKGRVPALVADKGILTETPAILAFIAQSFPQAQLAPIGDPFAPRRRHSTATCARPFTSRTPIACGDTAGPTTRPPSRP